MADWSAILQKLLTGTQQKEGGILGALADMSGRGELSPEDVLTLRKGPQSNQGIANILHNLQLKGAERRAAARDLAWESEDREITNDLKRAQAENLRALDAYRQGVLGIQQQKVDVQKEKNDILALKNEQEIELKKEDLQIKAQNAITAAANAATNARNATTAEQKLLWEKEYQERMMEYKNAQDLINNDLKRRALEVQQGYLEIAQEKKDPEIANIIARTGLTDAQADETRRKIEKMADEHIQNALKSIKVGQETGLLTPSGTKIAGEETGVFDFFGVNPPDPTVMEKIRSILGMDKEQTPRTPAPKKLTRELAIEYLRKAGGSKDLARQLAKADGYSF